jgi:hypothetical protein
MAIGSVGTAQVGQDSVGAADLRVVVAAPIYHTYAPRPMLMLTIGAIAYLYSSEEIELAVEQYGEAQYGEEYGP